MSLISLRTKISSHAFGRLNVDSLSEQYRYETASGRSNKGAHDFQLHYFCNWLHYSCDCQADPRYRTEGKQALSHALQSCFARACLTNRNSSTTA
jgi:hypothetical protein